MSTKAMLKETPNPTEGKIRFRLTDNLCRCTGYDKIVKAVQEAASRRCGEAVKSHVILQAGSNGG